MKRNKSIKTSGLGSGLSSLLGNQSPIISSIAKDNGNELYKMIPIEFIEPGPWQPRKDFAHKELEALASSIKNQGLIQPIIIKKDKEKKNKYLIIASQIANIHEMPAIIRNDVKDEKIAELALVENIQRSQLNPLEEAEGYQALTKKYNYTQQDISKAVGKSRSYIANVSRLLLLSSSAKKYLLEKKLTIGQLRPLIGKEDCDYLLEIIYRKNLNSRQVEKLIKEKNLKKTISITKELNILELEKELLNITGLRVVINFNSLKQSGNIKIDCKNLDELNYIISKIKS